MIRDVRTLDLSEYDLVISDFEPITAWVAKLQKKACIGVAHQYALRYPLPGPRISRVMNPFIHLFAPVNHAIGLHWHHFDAPILPPLIEPQLFPLSEEPDKYLVYLPFEAVDQVRQWLQPLTDFKFYVYCDIAK